MSTPVVIVLVLLVLFVLLALVYAAAAVVQLARIQAAVMKHRSSFRTVHDDRELYHAAGLDPFPVPRGDELPPEGEP